MARKLTVKVKTLDDVVNELKDKINQPKRNHPLIEMQEFPFPMDFDDDDYDEDEYLGNSHTEEISFIEFAIINAYLHDCFREKQTGVAVSSYGRTDNIGRLCYGGAFDITQPWWFNGKFKEDENEFFFQTTVYVDSRGALITQLSVTAKNGIKISDFETTIKVLKNIRLPSTVFPAPK